MSQREAFEAWRAKDSLFAIFSEDDDTRKLMNIAASTAWQAAIQHARDVAVKACENSNDDADACAIGAVSGCIDAIKEALK